MAYGRPSSSTFIVKTFLNISEYDERYLNKSINVANSAYNEMLSIGIKRLNTLRNNKRYWLLIDELKECDDEDKRKKKLIYDQLNVLCTNHNLTTTAFLDYLIIKRNNGTLYKRLKANELQLIAIHAFETIENVLYGKSKIKNLKFKSKYKESSFRNNRNDTGTRLIESSNPKYAYDLFVHSKHKIPIKRDNFTLYQQHCLLRADKIKYVQIKQVKIRGNILNKNIKKQLQTRIYQLSSEYPNVQCDMYSAILNKFTILENEKFKIDTKKLTNEFETYYNLMQLEIEKIRNNNTSRLNWYVN